MSGSNIFLGTSGWSYKEWEEVFYQKGEKRKLRAYSKVFRTVEVDSTFYRYPSKGMVMGGCDIRPRILFLRLSCQRLSRMIRSWV